MPSFKIVCIGLLCLLMAHQSFSQDISSLPGNMSSLPDKLFDAMSKKRANMQEAMSRQSRKYVKKFSDQEKKLQRELLKKDPALALSLFPDVDSQYNEIKTKATGISKLSDVYSSHLDSLSTALDFLKSTSLAGLSKSKLTDGLAGYKELQGELNYTELVKKYSQERVRVLKEQFERLGMTKQFQKYNKQVYYYKAQLDEYRRSFEDPSRAEARLLQAVRNSSRFKDFFSHNSQLSSFFALGGQNKNGNSGVVERSGLQTKAVVEQTLKERFGSSATVSQLLQKNLPDLRSVEADGLVGLKNKLSGITGGSYGNGKGGEETMPDFKPNQQKTRSFLNRLEYGGNIQSQKSRGIFPVSSDLGLSVGYRLNDKSVIGIGASYRLGWGNGWNKIRISHQGVSIRSFIDYKIRGFIFISGGYELNYRSAIHSVEQLKKYSAWQSSGLIGLMKKYQVSKKIKGNMQVLWDFLSYQQIPKVQPVLFRIGYNLK